MKTLLIIILSLSQFAFSQISHLIEQNNSINSLGFGNNFFNTEKLKVQQGFTIGSSLMGNEYSSYGIFTNNFIYNIKPDLQMTGGIHFLQKSGNIQYPFQQNNFDVLYNLDLKYQPWENTWVQLSITNLGINHYRNKLFKP